MNVHAEKVLAWLATTGAEDWHRSAETWNFDDGTAPLEWIVEQPDCDAATALLIFWRCQPGEWAAMYPNRSACTDPHHGAEYDLAVKIKRHWLAGRYPQKRFRYDPGAEWGVVPGEIDAKGHRDLETPVAMTFPVEGRNVDSRRFGEGLPLRQAPGSN